jgi:DNA-binding transcriptional ArsR family regulator
MSSAPPRLAPSTAEIALVAKLFAGFSDRTRLAILVELSDGERRVTDLVTALSGSQGNISGHLSCLKECGLVRDRPEGRQVFYRIAHPEVHDVLRSAEALLAVTGHHIQLCPNYGDER